MKSTTRQRAAQMRASRIRSLRGIRTSLIEDTVDREVMERIIDRQLASMGAETNTARHNRIINTPFDKWDDIYKTAKPYKITDADVKRYNSW